MDRPMDVAANSEFRAFNSIIAPEHFYSMLYAALLNKYLMKYDMTEQDYINAPLRSLPCQSAEFIDYSFSITTPSSQSNVGNSFADLCVFIDRSLPRIINKLFSDYLAPDEIADKINIWFASLPNYDYTTSTSECLVLNGELILKCWKTMVYDFISSPKTVRRLPNAPFLFPFAINEGFFSYNFHDDWISYQTLETAHAGSTLIYMLPFPTNDTFSYYAREIAEEFSTGIRQFFDGEKINIIEYFENTVSRLDSLQASYCYNEKKIEDFFNSDEGKALLLSPVVPVIHSVISWDSPELENYYDATVFYFENTGTKRE